MKRIHENSVWILSWKEGSACSKLKETLCGLADALFNWFNKLTSALILEGFGRSEINQCVLIRNYCIILVCADEMIALSRKQNVLEE